MNYIMYRKEKKQIEHTEEAMQLIIPEWNWQRQIQVGDISHIATYFGTLLKGNKNNQVIAGHDTDSVFHQLHFLKIGMIIVFTNQTEKNIYQVAKILTVSPIEGQYLMDTMDKQLTLITCAENDKKRLIVICDSIDSLDL